MGFRATVATAVMRAAEKIAGPHIHIPRSGPRWAGMYSAEVWDRGPVTGQWYCIRRTQFPNGVTDAGITNNEEVYFRGGAQVSSWYFLLIDNTSFSALNPADPMASHAGWIECVTYSEANRQLWNSTAAAGRVIGNTTSSTFTISGASTVQIKGAGLTTGSGKSGATGTLWSTGVYSGGIQTLNPLQQLKLSYSLTGTSS
jgi:hypothetical protein